jgi:hypothetical protein
VDRENVWARLVADFRRIVEQQRQQQPQQPPGASNDGDDDDDRSRGTAGLLLSTHPLLRTLEAKQLQMALDTQSRLYACPRCGLMAILQGCADLQRHHGEGTTTNRCSCGFFARHIDEWVVVAQ